MIPKQTLLMMWLAFLVAIGLFALGAIIFPQDTVSMKIILVSVFIAYIPLVVITLVGMWRMK